MPTNFDENDIEDDHGKILQQKTYFDIFIVELSL